MSLNIRPLADNLSFGDSDDTVYALTPHYTPGSTEVTLDIAVTGGLLPQGNYRLQLVAMPMGQGAVTAEVEPNNTVATATAMTLGGRASGTITNYPGADPSGESKLYVDNRQLCQRRLAALPPEGRALYRARVDALAGGDEQRDEVAEQDGPEQALDACLALGLDRDRGRGLRLDQLGGQLGTLALARMLVGVDEEDR